MIGGEVKVQLRREEGARKQPVSVVGGDHSIEFACQFVREAAPFVASLSPLPLHCLGPELGEVSGWMVDRFHDEVFPSRASSTDQPVILRPRGATGQRRDGLE